MIRDKPPADTIDPRSETMALIQINRQPSRLQLNVFGAMWLVVFAVVGGVVWGRGGPPWGVSLLAGAAVIVPVAGWIVPRFMRAVYLAMAYAALPVGLVLSFALLAAVYYLVLTPIGLLRRVCGGDPLTRRFDPGAESYWVPRESTGSVDMERYFRQI
jgi:hypothetical protein